MSETQRQAGAGKLEEATEFSALLPPKAAGIPAAVPSGRAQVTGGQGWWRGESSPDARHPRLFWELQTVGSWNELGGVPQTLQRPI